MKITGMAREWTSERVASRTRLRRPMMATEASCFPNRLDISYAIPDPPPIRSATFAFSMSPLNGDSISPPSLPPSADFGFEVSTRTQDDFPFLYLKYGPLHDLAHLSHNLLASIVYRAQPIDCEWTHWSRLISRSWGAGLYSSTKRVRVRVGPIIVCGVEEVQVIKG